jgi:RimJ/RimL family protein N-acetyltransferase
MAEAEPMRHVASGSELPLSNLGQLELLRGMVERGLTFRTKARGLSMTPLIRDGDVVTIDPMDRSDPRVGEVVAFVDSGGRGLALHRVVARKEAGWLLRGDNCRESDGVVPRDQILGRVVRVERNGRDADFGKGAKGAGIAWLSQTGGLARLLALARMPRCLASSALRSAQGLRLYKAIGRRIVSHVAIVEATQADLDTVRRWFKTSDIEAQMPSSTDIYIEDWVAKGKTKIVGFARLAHVRESGSPWKGHWLVPLVVRGRYRGLGIGEALTRRVIEDAGAQGAAEVLLVLFDDSNQAAMRLCRKLSFTREVVDALEVVFEDEKRVSGRRRVVMRKAL